VKLTPPQVKATNKVPGYVCWKDETGSHAFPILSTCPNCEVRAIVRLSDALRALTNARYLCHPLAGGCGQGFEKQPHLAPDVILERLGFAVMSHPAKKNA
jgi:hypothetical protein